MAKKEEKFYPVDVDYVDDYFPKPETGGVKGAQKRIAAREKAIKEAMEKAKKEAAAREKATSKKKPATGKPAGKKK